MSDKYAGSYRIIGEFETRANDAVCVGYDPQEILPYGVWISINNVLGTGEYFKSKQEAVNEMCRWINYYSDNYDEPRKSVV